MKQDKEKNIKSLNEIDDLTSCEQQTTMEDIEKILVRNGNINPAHAVDRDKRMQAHLFKSRLKDDDGYPVLHSDGKRNVFRTDEHMKKEDADKADKKGDEYILKGRNLIEQGKKIKNTAYWKKHQVDMGLEVNEQ